MANIVGYKRVFTGVIQGPGHFTRRVVKNPVATLGRLAILPNELLDDILSKRCDIQTIVTSFSLVNRGARKAVDTSLPFQRVSHYAPGALAAMLRTQVASFFTLEDLYDALCSNPSCGLCGSLGTLIWLPGCQRCCMPCLRTPELRSINKYAATKLFGVSEAALVNAPAVCSERGWDDFRDFRRLLSLAQVRAIAVEDAGGEAQLMTRINSVPERKEAYENFISRTGNSEVGQKAQCLVAAPLPYFNRRSGKIVRGLSCAGCLQFMESDGDLNGDTIDEECRRYDTVYTISGLISHVQTDCLHGQRIWKKHLKRSKQGSE
ncbi:uncharacterized protein ARMOST_02341 [Armillaria ostoyae]|uniref:F-box domain-containing protein n=1 Tax=Armillaria ostoyae TaxID=47428 RepID=A0A284QRG4_ARMOS|nr:uncharacterized protein ARMOST_02341 [Armillaria ostoyae]